MNVSYNSIENRWEIRENTTGNVVNLSLTQSDLQFLALSTTICDVESVE